MPMMKEMVQRFLFFILFLFVVIIVISGYEWFQSLFLFGSPYDQPMGDAVKVFEQASDRFTIPDRLLWFFRYGE